MGLLRTFTLEPALDARGFLPKREFMGLLEKVMWTVGSLSIYGKGPSNYQEVLGRIVVQVHQEYVKGHRWQSLRPKPQTPKVIAAWELDIV